MSGSMAWAECPHCGLGLADAAHCGAVCGARGGCALVCCPGCGRSVPHPGRSRLAHRLARWLARRRHRAQARAAVPAGDAATLASLATGARAWVASLAGSPPERAHHLATLGLVPGTALRLCQRHPVLVVEIGETTLALEPAVAAGIAVSTAPGPDAEPLPHP